MIHVCVHGSGHEKKSKIRGEELTKENIKIVKGRKWLHIKMEFYDFNIFSMKAKY